MNEIEETGIVPIGRVTAGRTDRRDDDWDDEVAVIELDERFPAEALAGDM